MKRVRIWIAVAAGAALVTLAWRIGVGEIAEQLRNLRVALPVVLLAGFARLLVQTRAWQTALRAEDIDVPQSRLLAVRLASQAAGYLAALGPVVSEPAKLVLLRSAGGVAAAAPATLVETGTYWFTTVILGLAGAGAAAFLMADARVVWAAAVFGAGLVLLATRRSLLSPLVRAAGPRAPGWLRSAELAEVRIRSFRDRRPQTFRTVLALNTVAQLLTLVEVAGVLWAVAMPASVPQVLAIEAAGRMVKILAAFIPGRIGADEGGAVASFALLGFPPAAGLTLVVARRVRDLLWCAAGIVWTARRTEQASLCMEER